MQLKIEIKMDSAAFEDNRLGEVSSILEQLADDLLDLTVIDETMLPYDLRDTNGNRVGTAKVTK